MKPNRFGGKIRPLMPEKEKFMSSLGESLNRAGISTIIFDFDDTLIDTSGLFLVQMYRFVSAVVDKNPELNWKDCWKKLAEYDDETYKKMAVRKEKLLVVAKLLDAHFKTAPSFSNHADILLEIYNRVPKLLDGTIDTLDAFKELGIPMALVTHANLDWTNLKLDALNLRQYFKHVEIADDTIPKGSVSWLNTIHALGFIPEQALVIGDSLGGDMVVSFDIGVKHGIWVEPPWNVHGFGEKPDGLIEVKSIKQVPEAIMKNF